MQYYDAINQRSGLLAARLGYSFWGGGSYWNKNYNNINRWKKSAIFLPRYSLSFAHEVGIDNEWQKGPNLWTGIC